MSGAGLEMKEIWTQIFTHKRRWIRQILILTLCISIAKAGLGYGEGAETDVYLEEQPTISGVTVSTNSFSPKNEQAVEISYTLSGPAKVSLKIFDFDDCLVRTLCLEKPVEARKQDESWDGKDEKGGIVPDEAYYFTIEAEDPDGDKYLYDPTTSWKMEVCELKASRYRYSEEEYTYEVPEMARVLIRLGIHKGPMLKTLVDWEPRLAGENIEYWNGMDESNLFEVWNNNKFTSRISYKGFPENTIISWGNFDTEIKEYKLDPGYQCKKKKIRDYAGEGERGIFPGYLTTKIYEKSPEVILSFPDFKDNNVPILHGKAIVRVNLGELDKRIIQDQQFEIIFFIDQEFFTEEEQGYFPYNWQWDLSELHEGEHILTVNVASFRGLVGTASRKVIVKK